MAAVLTMVKRRARVSGCFGLREDEEEGKKWGRRRGMRGVEEARGGANSLLGRYWGGVRGVNGKS